MHIPTAAQLAAVLRHADAIDPSQHGHRGDHDTPAIAAAYQARNHLVLTALPLAAQLGIPAGIGYDPASTHPIVAYIELPGRGAGQVSWHLPLHSQPWDGQHGVKTARITAWCRSLALPGHKLAA